jgi:short-subunit dehydrogenase
VIKEKVIVVTGASAGIGAALAHELAAPGATLVLAARDEQALAAVARLCEARGAKTLAVKTDVTVKEECAALIARAAAATGAIDILINNASVAMGREFAACADLAVFERLMAVNYLGAVYCTHYALPYLRKAAGMIVAISALQGKAGFPRTTGYSASKFAVQGFFDSLRIELAATGVGVLVVSPGPVRTRIHRQRLDGPSTPAEDAAVARNRHMMPVEVCAFKIRKAIERRRRELITHPEGRLLPWLRLLCPRWCDLWIASEVRRFFGESRRP